ncbi:mucin-binding protein, partial [Limosilactobacillus allomucosae]|uniref:mucin-binding protein n=1 Tax=Limosilactobacillus allomucosae TaxID=3142938 RepID=UPI003273EF98
YIDDTTGKTLKTKPLSGKTNAKSGYTTAKDIQDYQALGYKLISDDTNGAEIVFDNDDAVNQAYKIHLAHDYATVTSDMNKQAGTPINPDKNGAKWPEGSTKSALQHDVKRNITYVVVNGKKSAPTGVNDSLHYEAAATVDKVTGQVVKTVWSAPQDFKDVATPAVKGYTADKK